ncbi:IS200/IS605 family transposase [Testudinibacter sp. P27/CKL/0425]
MSYTKSLYHIIFRTKYGEPTIIEQNENALYRYIWGFIKAQNCVLHRINGMPDHLHLFIELHPSIALADFVQKLKTASHSWIDENKWLFPDFYAWSRGYCALTYCERDKDKIIRYIQKQKEHHQSQAFVDEMKCLFIEAGISVDEKYFDKNI